MLKGTAFLASAAAGAFALGGARHGFAANDVESVLAMMGWAEYISPNNISKWEEMTGSTLIYDSYASNDEMYSKLQLAAGNSGYDLGMNTDFMMPLLIKGGYLEKIDKSLVPTFAPRWQVRISTPTTPIRFQSPGDPKASFTISRSLKVK
jgi:spermidine/putrescine transport system substrate-binding protein